MKKKMVFTFSGALLLMAFLFGFSIKIIPGDKDNDLMQAMNKMMNRIQNMEMTGNMDKDFANIMAEHHEGAIDMANIVLKDGKEEKLAEMVRKSRDKQKDEQKKLRDLADKVEVKDKNQSEKVEKNKIGEKMDDNYKKDKSAQAKHELINIMENTMMQMEKMKMSGDVEMDFANMMVMHHQSGIKLAKQEVAKGKNPEIKEMSQMLIKDQEKEIAELKKWINENKQAMK